MNELMLLGIQMDTVTNTFEKSIRLYITKDITVKTGDRVYSTNKQRKIMSWLLCKSYLFILYNQICSEFPELCFAMSMLQSVTIERVICGFPS
jgi:hypothetical protein